MMPSGYRRGGASVGARAGVDAQLVVFEALPHGFWVEPNLPESDEAYHLMATFFEKHLAGETHKGGEQSKK